ncbi:MAG TPA: hypothetical protein GX721_09695 [Firmicutes bacterium]|nr:hypothetical protein [Bacillota bacterium]
MQKKKVGLIALSLPRERTDLAERFHSNAGTALKNAGFEVCTHEGLIFDSQECIRVARQLKDDGAGCILLLLGTWIDSPTVIDTVRAVDIPFAVWAEDNPASFSLTAGGIVHGSLDEFGLKHRFFYGSPSSRELISQVSAYVDAACCSTELDGERLCVVGGRVTGMYTTMADIIQIKEVFGVEMEHVDSLRVYLDAEDLDSEEVAECKRDVLAQFGVVNLSERVLDRSVRLYMALKRILVDKGYRMAAVKCMDEMTNNYCSFCLANSLLNDDGFTVSCEGDIYAALTMKILRTLSEGVALFGDINHVDHDGKIIRIVNCGSMPSSLAESRKDVDLENQYEYLSEAGGAVTVFSVKGFPATGARLFRIRGALGMVAFQGETIRRPKEEFKEAREFWPHAFMKLDCDTHVLVQNLRSNHMHVSPGHCLNALREFCCLKDLKLVVPGEAGPERK